LYAPDTTLALPNYIYPPPLAQAIGPLTRLPWEPFATLWLLLELGILTWLLWPTPTRYRLPLGIAFLPCVLTGNASWFVAAALALTPRWPAAWAVTLLTKVTPAVGLIWYVPRQEARPLVAALGAAVMIALASALAAPDAWSQWVEVVRSNLGQQEVGVTPWIPLWLRLTLAASLAVWAGRSGRWAPLALVVVLANADIFISTLAPLAALPRLTVVDATPKPSQRPREACMPAPELHKVETT
jgi:hypothetical protein